jgi:hypothetical protein
VRVALLQCELEHRHQAPHLAMCLYAADLRRDGHVVRCALVHPSALDRAADALAGRCDLLVLDSIFPFGLQLRLKDRVDAPIVVGGHNALQHALRGPADLAIVGPGRAALRRLAATLDRGESIEEVPGLWWRRPDGVLDCGPEAAGIRLAEELDPFEPDLDWDYFGPPRAPGSNLRVPSIVAELGCPWNRSVLDDGGFYAGVAPRPPDAPMTDRARARIDRLFVQREGGCTFCVLRYTPRTAEPREGAIDALAAQARVLVERGARGLSLQTEHPLPVLGPLLDRLDAMGLAERLDELHVRTIPWLLLRDDGRLEAAIARADALGLRLVMAQVGFEAFDAVSLAAYHKGIGAEENREAARLLDRLTRTHAGFVGTGGHGLVPLHPWATPAGLRETLEACRADAPWLLPSVHPGARVEIYDEWSPLFWKAQDDGLLVEAPDAFGWDWTFADSGTGEIAAVASALLAAGLSRDPLAGARAIGAVLDVFEREPDPALRRQAYLALRGSPVTPPPPLE